MMHFTHHSKNRVVTLDLEYRQDTNLFFKPTGLWISRDGPDSWEEWCKHNSERLLGQFKHGVAVRPEANLLWILSPAQLLDFTEKYKDREKLSFLQSHNIKWDAVASDYDGIMIIPYIYSCRLDPHCSWYYGWDCASGCIWNREMIAGVYFLEERAAA